MQLLPSTDGKILTAVHSEHCLLPAKHLGEDGFIVSSGAKVHKDPVTRANVNSFVSQRTADPNLPNPDQRPQLLDAKLGGENCTVIASGQKKNWGTNQDEPNCHNLRAALNVAIHLIENKLASADKHVMMIDVLDNYHGAGTHLHYIDTRMLEDPRAQTFLKCGGTIAVFLRASAQAPGCKPNDTSLSCIFTAVGADDSSFQQIQFDPSKKVAAAGGGAAAAAVP